MEHTTAGTPQLAPLNGIPSARGLAPDMHTLLCYCSCARVPNVRRAMYSTIHVHVQYIYMYIHVYMAMYMYMYMYTEPSTQNVTGSSPA